MEYPTGSGQPDRLPIIDAQQLFADQLATTCLRAEFAVHNVQNIDDVTGALEEIQPDVIVVDTSVQHTISADDGTEVLQALAKQGTQARILIVTHDSRCKCELLMLRGRSLTLQMLGHSAKPAALSCLAQLLEPLRQSEPGSAVPDTLQ